MSNRMQQVEGMVLHAHQQVKMFTRSRAAERAKLAAMAPSGARGDALLEQFDAETRATREAMLAPARAALTSLRDSDVLKSPPDFRPASAAEASWVAAICALAPSFSPRVLAQTLRTAAANGNVALSAALLPLAESYVEYRKPFIASNVLGSAMTEAANVLRTPDVIASEHTAAWCDGAEADLRTLNQVCGGPRPEAALAVHESLGAFSTLEPKAAP